MSTISLKINLMERIILIIVTSPFFETLTFDPLSVFRPEHLQKPQRPAHKTMAKIHASLSF